MRRCKPASCPPTDEPHDQDDSGEAIVFERVARIVDGIAETRLHAEIFSGTRTKPTPRASLIPVRMSCAMAGRITAVSR